MLFFTTVSSSRAFASVQFSIIFIATIFNQIFFCIFFFNIECTLPPPTTYFPVTIINTIIKFCLLLLRLHSTRVRTDDDDF